MVSASPAPTALLLQHPLLTTVGLCIETHAGLTRAAEQRLERECGLSGQWFEVLIRLARTPGQRLRMSDLADQTTLSASGLTRAVDRLEAAGLVGREACPTDRRSIYAVLTEAGEEKIMAAVPVHVGHVIEMFSSVFTASELDTFTALIRRLRDAINPDAERASRPDRALA